MKNKCIKVLVFIWLFHHYEKKKKKKKGMSDTFALHSMYGISNGKVKKRINYS